ncbi:TPA: hypothetical protein ACGO1T_000784 [Streptococcus suis]
MNRKRQIRSLVVLAALSLWAFNQPAIRAQESRSDQTTQSEMSQVPTTTTAPTSSRPSWDPGASEDRDQYENIIESSGTLMPGAPGSLDDIVTSQDPVPSQTEPETSPSQTEPTTLTTLAEESLSQEDQVQSQEPSLVRPRKSRPASRQISQSPIRIPKWSNQAEAIRFFRSILRHHLDFSHHPYFAPGLLVAQLTQKMAVYHYAFIPVMTYIGAIY